MQISCHEADCVGCASAELDCLRGRDVTVTELLPCRSPAHHQISVMLLDLKLHQTPAAVH